MIGALNFCEQFGGEKAASCLSLVNQTMSEIVTAISEGSSTISICKELGFADPTCDFCLYVVAYIEGILVDTKVIDAVIAEVDADICAKLPGSFSAICDALAGEYVPIIVQLIEQGLGPQTVCSKLKFCTV